MTIIAYRCGVPPGRRAGHYCEPSDGPLTPWGWVEGGYPLLDWHPDRDGLKAPRQTRRRGRPSETEGEFVHLIVDGWTLLAAWDRSADKRAGCSMSFAMQAEMAPDDALAFVRDRWPREIARMEAHVGHAMTVRELA